MGVACSAFLADIFHLSEGKSSNKGAILVWTSVWSWWCAPDRDLERKATSPSALEHRASTLLVSNAFTSDRLPTALSLGATLSSLLLSSSFPFSSGLILAFCRKPHHLPWLSLILQSGPSHDSSRCCSYWSCVAQCPCRHRGSLQGSGLLQLQGIKYNSFSGQHCYCLCLESSFLSLPIVHCLSLPPAPLNEQIPP